MTSTIFDDACTCTCCLLPVDGTPMQAVRLSGAWVGGWVGSCLELRAHLVTIGGPFVIRRGRWVR